MFCIQRIKSSKYKTAVEAFNLRSALRTVSLSCTSTNRSTQRCCEEIKIPVPWGHIAGKWWEPYDRRPIVALHGWQVIIQLRRATYDVDPNRRLFAQDNCGTFDRLMPLLPKHVGFLALDAPGHGLSSRYPPGIFYHAVNFALLIRQLLDIFKWPKISLMGHSMGAIQAFSYTTLFNDSVDFLICLDGLKPFSNFPGSTIKKTGKAMDEFIKYDGLCHSGAEPPSYSFEEMIDKLHNGTRKSVATENCHFLLERSIAPSKTHPDKFYFTRDPRVKVANITSLQHDDIMEHVKRVTRPVLITKCMGGYVEKKEYFYEALEHLKKSSVDCRYVYLNGSHHAHLNQPELFVDLITEFISTYDVEDRTGGGIECLRNV